MNSRPKLEAEKLAYKILGIVRDVGKYITLVTCAISILRGIIYWKIFATPIWISFVCILGVILWVVGGVGVFIIKYKRNRESKKLMRFSIPDSREERQRRPQRFR